MARWSRPDDRPGGFDVDYWRRRLEAMQTRDLSGWWAGVPETDEDGAVSFEVARRRRQAQEDG